ncbi:MAG: hypothetical protein P8Y72_15220 [Anaerolineales bacterium]
MKRTIWVPVMIGVVSAALILVVSEVKFVIPLGNNYSIGIGEIFNTFSAALGGPIAVIITLLVTSIGHFLLNSNLYTDRQFFFIVLADAIVHIGAMLVVTIIYYRVLYPQARKIGLFVTGWWVTIGVYYYLILLPLQVVLLNFADPGFGATYPSFARIFLPEFIGTATITTLIWFAAPIRYRRPLWC